MSSNRTLPHPLARAKNNHDKMMIQLITDYLYGLKKRGQHFAAYGVTVEPGPTGIAKKIVITVELD
jgi:hypothetical protein